MSTVRPSIGQRIKSLWGKFSEREYRVEFCSAHFEDSLAVQINTMRTARGWTQGELAMYADMKQPRISKLEDSCEGASLTTLKKLADAFDVALSVEFIPYSRLAEKVIAHSADVNVASFQDDHPECIKDYSAHYVEPICKVVNTPVLFSQNPLGHHSLVTKEKASFSGISQPVSVPMLVAQ